MFYHQNSSSHITVVTLNISVQISLPIIQLTLVWENDKEFYKNSCHQLKQNPKSSDNYTPSSVHVYKTNSSTGVNKTFIQSTQVFH